MIFRRRCFFILKVFTDWWAKTPELLTRFKDKDERRLLEIVKGDETWLYFFELSNNWIIRWSPWGQVTTRQRTSPSFCRWTEYLQENNIDTLPHPPYSHDLSHCDFWLNPHIKGYMRDRLERRSAVGSALYQKRILRLADSLGKVC